VSDGNRGLSTLTALEEVLPAARSSAQLVAALHAAGFIGCLAATWVHYQSPNAPWLSLVAPPTLAAMFLFTALYLLCYPDRIQFSDGTAELRGNAADSGVTWGLHVNFSGFSPTPLAGGTKNGRGTDVD
jgi:hypothetical protein